jgi:hypothetical protein
VGLLQISVLVEESAGGGGPCAVVSLTGQAHIAGSASFRRVLELNAARAPGRVVVHGLVDSADPGVGRWAGGAGRWCSSARDRAWRVCLNPRALAV